MHALNRTTDPGPGSISTASDGFDSDFNIWTLTELHMFIVHMHEERYCFFLPKLLEFQEKVTLEVNVMGVNSQK